jgi:Rieske Fe-S protein
MERRQFLTSSCNFCLLAATGYFLSELAACAPSTYKVIKTEIIQDEIRVPIASFINSPLQFLRPKDWVYDIAVQKSSDNSYQALLMQCTHQENQLTPTGNGYTCSLHGSQFSRDGHVKKGPAENPLKQYTTSVNQSQVIIHLNSTK